MCKFLFIIVKKINRLINLIEINYYNSFLLLNNLIEFNYYHSYLVLYNVVVTNYFHSYLSLNNLIKINYYHLYLFLINLIKNKYCLNLLFFCYLDTYMFFYVYLHITMSPKKVIFLEKLNCFLQMYNCIYINRDIEKHKVKADRNMKYH